MNEAICLNFVAGAAVLFHAQSATYIEQPENLANFQKHLPPRLNRGFSPSGSNVIYLSAFVAVSDAITDLLNRKREQS